MLLGPQHAPDPEKRSVRVTRRDPDPDDPLYPGAAEGERIRELIDRGPGIAVLTQPAVGNLH